MLPSSHPVLINEVLHAMEQCGQECGEETMPCNAGVAHRETIPAHGVIRDLGDAQSLTAAFGEFILASSRLEESYRALQAKVDNLSQELSERNRQLRKSLSDNERIRQALQNIVESMPCGVIVLDRNEQISTINPEAGRLLALDSHQFHNVTHASLRQISEVSGLALDSWNANESRADLEQEFCLRLVGQERWLEVRRRRLYLESDELNHPDQTILILRDVSAQKRAQADREAGRKAMALVEISAILAHEIRNPLASLELFAELIEDDDEHRDKWISNMRAGIRALSGTVNNVLSLRGSGSMRLVPLELLEVLRESIDFVWPLAEQAMVQLELIRNEETAMVMGNSGALRQAVLNLLSNAFRHTPSGGKVSVRLRRNANHGSEDQVVVEVSDTGSGIRPDQIDHLFEVGFSGNGDTSGLGLAVCDKIVKLHGGRIWASNGVESGAQFSFSLPVVQLDRLSRAGFVVISTIG